MRLTWQQVRALLLTADTLIISEGHCERSEDVIVCVCVSGGDVGHVQPVSGGDGSPGLLQVERRHLRFHWPTLELPAGNKVTVTLIYLNLLHCWSRDVAVCRRAVQHAVLLDWSRR